MNCFTPFSHRSLFVIAVLLLPLRLLSQSALTQQYLDEAGDHAALFRGHLEAPYNSNLLATHPFWESVEFTPGEVCYDGIFYPQVMLRFDVFRQLLSVMAPEGGHPIVPDQDKVSYFTMYGMRFERRDQSFYCLPYIGQHLSLWHLRRKVTTTDRLIEKRYVKDLATADRFFLQGPDGSMHPVRRFSHVTRLYSQYRQQLKALRRAQHLRFRRTDQAYNSLLVLAPAIDQLLLQDQGPAPLQPRSGSAQPSTTMTSPLQLRSGSARPSAITPSALTPSATRPHPFVTLQAPDSLFTDATLDVTLPAFWAYQPNVQTRQYDEEQLILDGSVTSSIEPIREQHILDEVEVSGFQQKVGTSLVGAEKFRPALLKNIPLALGEADVMKVMQTLPGVKTMGEASSGFNVRGGASDQNLILLNGNTIYNPMHLFGLFSAFNSDVIGETELYKSGIPSEYGGRISSVMNITSRVPERKEWHGSASIGVLTSKATLDAPIVPERVSLLLGGRTTYSDWMLDRLPSSSGYRDGTAGFWDLSATLAITPNRNHRISLYVYTSHDRFSFTPYDKYTYANTNASVEWKGRFGDNLSTLFSAGYDHYDYTSDDTEVPSSAARLSFDINQYFTKFLTNLQLNDQHRLQLGLHGQFYDIAPGRYEPLGDDSFIALNQLQNDRAVEASLFAEEQWKPFSELTLTGGLRYTLFHSNHPGKEQTYQAPEFRLSASYQLADEQSLKFGFNTMHQFIHKVSNTTIMSPTDTWVLSNANIEPQTGYQVAAGYYYQTDNHQYELSLEAYYKRMDHYLTYRSAGKLVMNPDLENDVIGTQGQAYGIELQLRKPFGRLNGWVSYSYSRTLLRQNRQVAGLAPINGGDWFAADYDRPHELKLVSNFKFTQRYSLSVNGDYSTGRPITIPAGQYYSFEQDCLMPFYTDRNGYRLPDYLRIDASFNVEPSHHLTNLTHHWLSFGVYNLLGRRNAYSIYYVVEEGQIQGYKLSIFGAPIPFISYNIKF